VEKRRPAAAEEKKGLLSAMEKKRQSSATEKKWLAAAGEKSPSWPASTDPSAIGCSLVAASTLASLVLHRS
jgi:hypothetical protein